MPGKLQLVRHAPGGCSQLANCLESQRTCWTSQVLDDTGGSGVVPQFLDVSRVHPHCKLLTDNVSLEALGLDPSQCLRLKRCWNGTRNRGQAFEFVVRGEFKVNNFSQGAYSLCVYRHKTRRLWNFVHGDDYVGPMTCSTPQA